MAQDANKSETKKVLEVWFKDGGVDFPGVGAKASLKSGAPKAMALGIPMQELEMSLDKFSSWVVVRYSAIKNSYEVWVPREHCRSILVES